MDHIRVATFNVRHCRGPDDRVDVERTARTIRALAVDVLALQELDAGWERSGGEDQPARLAELTGLTLSFYPTISHEGSYGIALAGNRLEDVHLESLPRVGNEEPRAVIVARRDGTTFLATHLSRREGARRAQVRRLAEIAREVTPPVVIVGDLNTSVRGLAPLLDEGFDPGPPTPTHPVRRPRRQMDFILAGPGLALVSLEAVPSDASDHLPLAATLTPRF